MTKVSKVVTRGTTFLKQNIATISAGVGGLAIGGAVGYLAGNKSSVPRKSKRSTGKNRKSKTHSYKRQRRTRYTPHTAGKKKDTSHKRIRQTKNGQPYVILANGRAKFITKSSAKLSRKRKGGRY